jgi:hypothetical protein
MSDDTELGGIMICMNRDMLGIFQQRQTLQCFLQAYLPLLSSAVIVTIGNTDG